MMAASQESSASPRALTHVDFPTRSRLHRFVQARIRRGGQWHRGAAATGQPQPAVIRRILTVSAKRLAPGGQRDDKFGSGLVEPLKALQLADPRTAMTAPVTPTSAQR
jgi:hypothetical protein